MGRTSAGTRLGHGRERVDAHDRRCRLRSLGDDEGRDHAEHAVEALDVGQDVAVERPDADAVASTMASKRSPGLTPSVSA